MSDAYSVGFKDGAAAGYKLAIEDMKLDKKPQIMKKYERGCPTLLARHNALVEAVAWERECCQDIRPLVAWARLYVLHGEDYVDAVAEALREIQDAASAEVDRLIANETTADCKGEG